MDGLGVMLLVLFLLMAGPPVVFLIIGIVKHTRSNIQSAKIFYILAVAWVVIGGGICATLIGA